MRYLPILEELFHSDTVCFFLVALGITVLAGLGMGRKKAGIGCGTALAVYLVCEAASNVHTNYLVEIILLVVGTCALGCLAGFFFCCLAGVWAERGAPGGREGR